MIACGFDAHRAQITFDLLDQQTGELRRGRIAPATRTELRRWLAGVEAGRLVVAVEGTTGWRFVAEEVAAAGGQVVVAEPAETRALRGPKRRAKTDRADARWLRELLVRGELPQSWIPPEHLIELRPYRGLAEHLRRHELEETERPETALPRLPPSTIMSPAFTPSTKLRLDPRAPITAANPASRSPPDLTAATPFS
jgi:hypothetical protein